MAAVFEKDEAGGIDEFVEFFADERRGDLVFAPPDQEGRGGDLVQVVAQVMADGRFGGSDHPDGGIAVIDDAVDLIHQFFGGDGRVEKCGFRFFPDVFVIPAFGEGIAHRAFEQPGAAGQDDGGCFFRVAEYVQQGDMPAERIAQDMDLGVFLVLDELGHVVYKACDGDLAEGQVENRQYGNHHIIRVPEMTENTLKVAEGAEEAVQEDQIFSAAASFYVVEFALFSDI